MRVTAAVTVCASLAAAAPFKFPLPNGFPNPSQKNVGIIEKQAGGTLPNTPLPKSASADSITALQLIALNEIFEVAYFTELLTNVTSGKPGYTKLGSAGDAKAILTQVRAQEELHALGANAILKSVGAEPIKPCEYKFPVDNFEDAIALAATFTELVLSVLPEAQSIFAASKPAQPLISLVGSIIAQEGEQTGYYRFLGGEVPSSAPFLTKGSPDFAYTALMSFIVPGSCPNINTVKGLTAFKTLNVIGKPTTTSKTVTFNVPGKISAADYSVVFISGQNYPVTVPITHVTCKADSTTFEAAFPFAADGFAKGLTIGAVVKGTGEKFASPDAVAAKTVFGPGLITVD